VGRAPWIDDIETSEGAMKTAIASATPVVGVLALLALTALVDEAGAQAGAGSAPATVAPNLKHRPEPLPPVPRAQQQPPEEDAPSASEEPPPAGRGCPDHGRKLELIV
jgi:hypothetical protein